MADGLFYNDLREPFIIADLPAISPLATAVALYTPSAFPVLGGQYFSRPGKALKIQLFGRMSSLLTPGNLSWAVYYGTGASANGVLLASSAPKAWLASQTNDSWYLDVIVTCRTTGSAGTLFCTGYVLPRVTSIVSTLQPVLIPDTAAAVSGACDLTAALIISVQAIRSGSTAETMQVHQMQVTALNQMTVQGGTPIVFLSGRGRGRGRGVAPLMPVAFPIGITPFGVTDSDIKGPIIPKPILFAVNGLRLAACGVFHPIAAMNPYPSTKLLIAGVSRDNTGAVLANCACALYRTADDVMVERVTSDANGNYSFSTVGLAAQYYVVAYKTGAPVRGTSDNTLAGTISGNQMTDLYLRGNVVPPDAANDVRLYATGPDSGSVNATIAITGVSVIAAIGLAIAIGAATLAATGVSGSSAIGTPQATGTAVVSTAGVSAGTTIGATTESGSAVQAITGVSAASAIGTVSPSANASMAVSGVSAMMALGIVTAEGYTVRWFVDYRTQIVAPRNVSTIEVMRAMSDQTVSLPAAIAATVTMRANVVSVIVLTAGVHQVA